MSSGKNHYAWKGGRFLRADGYVQTICPGHPRSYHNYVLEHILIAEKALGKPLPHKVVVHHHSPKQLVICQDQAYHLMLHRRQRALQNCGHAGWRRCYICHQYDAPENLYIPGKVHQPVYHLSCVRERYRLKMERLRMVKEVSE